MNYSTKSRSCCGSSSPEFTGARWLQQTEDKGAAYSSPRRKRSGAGKGFEQFYGFRFPWKFFDGVRELFGHHGLCVLPGEFPELLVELRILESFPGCILENRNSILGRPGRK